MSAPPAFSSFPELPESSSHASSPRLGPTAPSFSSFPDTEPQRRRPLNKPTSDSDDRAVNHHREQNKEKERGTRDWDRGSSRTYHERHPSSHKDQERKERRSRDEQRESKRHKESEQRDKDEREHKEARRQREREKARHLIYSKVVDDLPETTRKREEKTSDKWSHGPDEGVPWYESSTAKAARPGYAEPFEFIASKAFFVDTVGDKDAVKYGSTSSLATPRFYRDGRGRILGLSDGLRVVHTRERTQKGLEIAPLGRPYIPRYSSRQLESSAARHLRRIILQPAAVQDGLDANQDLVRFDVRPKRQVVSEDVPSYRSISGHADAADSEDEGTAAVEAGLGRYATLEEDVRRQTSETERHLQLHPDDVETWIRYSTLHLKLSPELASLPSSGLVDPSKLPTTRANAEVTLSILSRALDADAFNSTSTELHLAYLRAAEAFWPAAKVTERWQSVLNDLQRRGTDERIMDVWLGYIEWREGQGFGSVGQGHDKGGGVDEVIEVYAECLSALSSSQTSGSQQAREENQVYLMLRACLFMKQAGYTERALASFQALIEVTFFKPDHLRPLSRPAPDWFERLLAEFGVFWESEAPRIGETGAVGWRATTNGPAPEPTAAPEPDLSSEDPFENWLLAERHAERRAALPARATDLDADDDPYRIILFSDVRVFLFPVQTPEVRLQLLYAFLTFLGLPFSPPDVPTTSASAVDPHLRWAIGYNASLRSAFWPAKAAKRALPWQTVGGEPMEPEWKRTLVDPFGCSVKSWAEERATLFARSSKWFRDLDSVDLSHIDIGVVRNALNMLRPVNPDPSFTLALLGFEAAVSPKGAVKVAKTILSSERDNLILWDGYARIERQRGNIAAARSVYVTALQAAESIHAPSEDQVELWSAWAEMEWDEGDEVRCLEVLVLASGAAGLELSRAAEPTRSPGQPTAISMLRARQHYASIPLPVPQSQLVLSTLFRYLADTVDAARSVILEQIAKLPSGSYETEAAYQLLCRVLFVHSSRHASPASLSRDAYELAIASFPNNTMFLSLYLFSEMGGRVYGRIQSLVSHITRGDCAGIVGHLWAVWAEAVSAARTFWDKGGGGAERVRTALDRGINSALGKHSVALWKLYIEFESHMGRFEVAKTLCYRAVTAIGGCKDLYLLAFSPALRPHFTSRELKDWAELMVERGIRIRVPYEDFWDNGDEQDGVELPEDEEPEEDELGFLREREVLKPY